MNIELGNYIVDQESRDPSRMNNGGEYEFGRYPVLKDSKEVGQLLNTSAEFDYCELNGSFQPTQTTRVNGTTIVFHASKQEGLPESISKKKFLELISRH